jgi:hypothetical protein
MEKDPLLNRIKTDFNLPSSEVLNSNIYSALDDLAENPTYVGVVNHIQYDYKESTESSETFLMELEKYRINYGDIVTNESVALQVKNPSSGVLSLLGTFGNFSLVKGKQKSRKSFFINLIISSILKTDTSRGIISATEDPKQNILYIDTEQGKSHVTMANNRIWENSVSDEHHRLHTYALRSMSPAERLESIETLIKKIDKLGFVVIDGIKDLVTSVNDEVEASKIASKLLKWSEELNIHIMVVLHENPSSTKARGHLGTELTNKAETIIGIEVDSKKPDVSIVKPASCRNIPFESFAFSVDERGHPFILEDYAIRSKAVKEKSVMELTDNEKYDVLCKVFNEIEFIGYKELETSIKSILNDKGFKKVKYSSNTIIKNLITYSREHSLIIQDGNNKPYRLNQQFIDS